MEKTVQRIWKGGLTLLFGVGVLLFWGVCYRGHIFYQEQFQLFLIDAGYWWERIAVPGGLADYVAEFLTQFYYHFWLGAFILAVCFISLQRLTWRLMCLQGTADSYYPLSFLPAVLLWYYMGDENVLLSLPIALLLALWFCRFYPRTSTGFTRTLFLLVALPLLYWVAGPVHFILVGWVMACEWQTKQRTHNLWSAVGIGGAILLYGFFCPLLAGLWVQYPVYRLLGGINYYRFPALIPWMQLVIIGVLALLPLVTGMLPVPRRNSGWMTISLIVLMAVGGAWLVPTGCNFVKEQAMVFDHWVRYKQWHRVVAMVDRTPPKSAFAVVCLNLSLAKTGQLGDARFRPYQQDIQVLLPDFQRDYFLPLPASEVYYHLGMVNTAQRFVFESMEAIPNFRKSSRSFKRLAETNLINGQYEVAAKYLRALQKTLFYKEWADGAMTFLYNEEKINSHPEWGWLRQVRYKDDFLFDYRELGQMLARLYEHNQTNQLAFEYLIRTPYGASYMYNLYHSTKQEGR